MIKEDEVIDKWRYKYARSTIIDNVTASLKHEVNSKELFHLKITKQLHKIETYN